MSNNQIACTLCGHKMRKSMYDMKRHWDSKHKGKEMKYKIVHGVSGVDSLDSHGFKSSTSPNKNWGRLHWTGFLEAGTGPL